MCNTEGILLAISEWTFIQKNMESNIRTYHVAK